MASNWYPHIAASTSLGSVVSRRYLVMSVGEGSLRCLGDYSKSRIQILSAAARLGWAGLGWAGLGWAGLGGQAAKTGAGELISRGVNKIS